MKTESAVDMSKYEKLGGQTTAVAPLWANQM